MPKYLVKATYSAEGTRGLIKDGGTGRQRAVQGLIESVGGTLESFYYVLGEEDLIWICDLPTPADAMAMSLAVNSARGAQIHVTRLLTVDEVDQAVSKAVVYHPPNR